VLAVVSQRQQNSKQRLLVALLVRLNLLLLLAWRALLLLLVGRRLVRRHDGARVDQLSRVFDDQLNQTLALQVSQALYWCDRTNIGMRQIH
jgi:hypothetical protein